MVDKKTEEKETGKDLARPVNDVLNARFFCNVSNPVNSETSQPVQQDCKSCTYYVLSSVQMFKCAFFHVHELKWSFYWAHMLTRYFSSPFILKLFLFLTHYLELASGFLWVVEQVMFVFCLKSWHHIWGYGVKMHKNASVFSLLHLMQFAVITHHQVLFWCWS